MDIVERLRENSAEIVADTLPRWKNIDEDMDKAADEIERLRKIESAAKNLISVKGRHHAELAYKMLEEVLR